MFDFPSYDVWMRQQVALNGFSGLLEVAAGASLVLYAFDLAPYLDVRWNALKAIYQQLCTEAQGLSIPIVDDSSLSVNGESTIDTEHLELVRRVDRTTHHFACGLVTFVSLLVLMICGLLPTVTTTRRDALIAFGGIFVVLPLLIVLDVKNTERPLKRENDRIRQAISQEKAKLSRQKDDRSRITRIRDFVFRVKSRSDEEASDTQ